MQSVSLSAGGRIVARPAIIAIWGGTPRTPIMRDGTTRRPAITGWDFEASDHGDGGTPAISTTHSSQTNPGNEVVRSQRLSTSVLSQYPAFCQYLPQAANRLRRTQCNALKMHSLLNSPQTLALTRRHGVITRN